MSKIASIALPIAGAFFGGPIGAAIGGGLGSAVNGGDFGDIAKGALISYGGSALGGALGGGGATPGFNPALDSGGVTPGFNLAGGASAATDAVGLGASGFNPSNLVGLNPTDSAFVNIPGAGFNSPISTTGAGFGGMLPTDSAFVNIPGATPNPSAPLGVYGGETSVPGFGGGMNLPTPSEQQAPAIGGSTVGPGVSSPQSFFDQAKGAFQGFSNQLTDFAKPVTSLFPKVSPQVKQGLGLASGGLSLYSGYKGIQAAEEMRRKAAEYLPGADPLEPYRSGAAASLNTNLNRGPNQYQMQLDRLLANPDSLSSTPGYAAGLQAVERRLASQGFTGSGNAKVALQKYGGDFYAQEVERLRRMAADEENLQTNKAQQLMMLAGGGNRNPATALNAIQSANTLQGQGLASIGYGVRGLGY